MDQNWQHVIKHTNRLHSTLLGREVATDFYLPVRVNDFGDCSLLLINDGQDMAELGLQSILEYLYAARQIEPLLCIAVHASADRKMEYGTAKMLDYKGRGAKAQRYTEFILKELIPYAARVCRTAFFRENSFAGFSLGGLSALDIVWNHPREFRKVGVFSGSLWWRTKDKGSKHYSDDKDRIMQQQIRKGEYHAGLRFFFECGSADELEDRNHNGVIDSIDDTLDLIKELVAKGYREQQDILYLQLKDGKHDVATWSKAMPSFLRWGWGIAGTGEL